MALRLFFVAIVASLALDFSEKSVWTSRYQSMSVEMSRQSDVSMPNGLKAFLNEVPVQMPVQVAAATPTHVTIDPVDKGVSIAVISTTQTELKTIPVAPPVAVVAAVPNPLPEHVDRSPIFVFDEADLALVEAVEPMPAPVVDEPKAPVVVVVELPPAPAADEVKAPMIEVVDLTPPAPVDPDAAFKKVVNTMTASFAADVATPQPVAEPTPILADATPEVSDDMDMDPALAQIPGYEAEKCGAQTSEQPQGCVDPEIAATPVEVPRPSQLTQAVRLTGLALNAWTNLLRQGGPGATLRR